MSDYLGDLVWSEDDALPPDRETMSKAMLRICGMAYHTHTERKPLIKFDIGDGVFEVYPEWVLFFSYPGNSAIYKRKK